MPIEMDTSYEADSVGPQPSGGCVLGSGAMVPHASGLFVGPTMGLARVYCRLRVSVGVEAALAANRTILIAAGRSDSRLHRYLFYLAAPRTSDDRIYCTRADTEFVAFR